MFGVPLLLNLLLSLTDLSNIYEQREKTQVQIEIR